MFGRKHEFKADRTGASLISRLYLTRKQRLSLLRWTLYGLFLLFLSLVQDVILCQMRLGGATTDLVSAGILLLCVILPTETCAVFALVGSLLYYFSGMAAGPYSIVFLTGLGIVLNIFRCGYLQKNFLTTWLCASVALMAYELLVFLTGLFLGHTTIQRLGGFLTTGGLSVAVMPLMYVVLFSISKIGGEAWKE